MKDWIRFGTIATAAGLIAFWLSAATDEAKATDRDSTDAAASPDEADDDPVRRPISFRRTLRTEREDHRKLQKAVDRRNSLRQMARTLARSQERRDARERGEHTPPTIGECAHIVGAGKGEVCPLPFESPEALRYLADCDVLNFDLPWHIYEGSRERGGPPWEQLKLTPEQRKALEGADRKMYEELYPLMQEAYRASFGREPPDGLTLSDFHLEEMGRDKSNVAWAFGLAARVRLGEVPEAEVAELPPVARYYATLAISGDAYERSIAEIVGSEQARELRRRDSGWGAQGVTGAGKCSDQDTPEEP